MTFDLMKLVMEASEARLPADSSQQMTRVMRARRLRLVRVALL